MLSVLPHWRRCCAGDWQPSSVTNGHQHHLGPRNLRPEQRHDCESLLRRAPTVMASARSVGKRARYLADALSDCGLLKELSIGLTKPSILRLLFNCYII